MSQRQAGRRHNKSLHLTGLSCAEIKVAAFAWVLLSRRRYCKPARQVSSIPLAA